MQVIFAITPAYNMPVGNTQATTKGPLKKLETQAWKTDVL